MPQHEVSSILEALEEAQKLLQTVENKLKTLLIQQPLMPKEITSKRRKQRKRTLTVEEAQLRWRKIRDSVSSLTFPELFNDSVSSLSYEDLRSFIRYNRLPVDTRGKKEEMVKQIAQVLRAGAAIQGERVGGKRDNQTNL